MKFLYSFTDFQHVGYISTCIYSNTVNPLYTDTLYNDKIHHTDNLNFMKPLQEMIVNNVLQEYCNKTLTNSEAILTNIQSICSRRK